MTYTYIIKSDNLYKIGKSKNINQRFNTLKIGNPNIELITYYKGNIESLLHKEFKNKRVSGEWFNLLEEDLNRIKIIGDNIKEESLEKEVELSKKSSVYENYKLLKESANMLFFINFERIHNLNINLREEYHNNNCIGFLLIDEGILHIADCIPSKDILNVLVLVIKNGILEYGIKKLGEIDIKDLI